MNKINCMASIKISVGGVCKDCGHHQRCHENNKECTEIGCKCTSIGNY